MSLNLHARKASLGCSGKCPLCAQCIELTKHVLPQHWQESQSEAQPTTARPPQTSVLGKVAFPHQCISRNEVVLPCQLHSNYS